MMSRTYHFVALLLAGIAVLSILGGCRQGNNAAIVNDQGIPMEKFERRVEISQSFVEESEPVDWESQEGQDLLAEIRQDTLDTMIDEAMIHQVLAEADLSVEAEALEEARSQLSQSLWEAGYAGLEDYLEQLGISEAEFEELLTLSLERDLIVEEIIELPDTLPQVHIRHILLLTQEEAEAALERVNQGEDFATVVEDVSTDRTSPGGDLGWLPTEMLPDSLILGIADMQAGNIGIVLTEYGFHVVEILDRSNGAIQEEIASNSSLVLALKQGLFSGWLEQLRQQAKIERLIEEN
jgi:parvulin-like peptidyl-prolyl isomerase